MAGLNPSFPPSLKLNKIKLYERPYGASKMQENLTVARVLPLTPLGELTVLPIDF